MQKFNTLWKGIDKQVEMYQVTCSFWLPDSVWGKIDFFLCISFFMESDIKLQIAKAKTKILTKV